MKKTLLLCCFSIAMLHLFACDVCGSGSGNYYSGLLPQFRKRFIGLRYQQSLLHGHLGPDGQKTYLSTTERFRSAELWGGFNLGSRFRLMFSMPVNFMDRKNSESHQSGSGPGDLTVLAYYQLLNKPADEKGDFSQNLWAGIGIKAPTGKYNNEESNIGQSVQNNFQLGSGSTDFSLNMMYDISVKNIGINFNAAYKMNTRNRFDYQYGNKFTANVLAYYRVRLSETVSVAPNAGVLIEAAGKDESSPGVTVFDSGGRSLNAVAGVELGAGRYSLGLNFQQPASQRLAEGKVRAGQRTMAYISYSF